MRLDLLIFLFWAYTGSFISNWCGIIIYHNKYSGHSPCNIILNKKDSNILSLVFNSPVLYSDKIFQIVLIQSQTLISLNKTVNNVLALIPCKHYFSVHISLHTMKFTKNYSTILEGIFAR